MSSDHFPGSMLIGKPQVIIYFAIFRYNSAMVKLNTNQQNVDQVFSRELLYRIISKGYIHNRKKREQIFMKC